MFSPGRLRSRCRLTWAPYLDPDLDACSFTWTPASHPSRRGPIQITAIGIDVALRGIIGGKSLIPVGCKLLDLTRPLPAPAALTIVKLPVCGCGWLRVTSRHPLWRCRCYNTHQPHTHDCCISCVAIAVGAGPLKHLAALGASPPWT